jgi:serine protease
VRTLPGGPDPRVEVMASDGVLTSSDISARGLDVPMKPPRISIAAPAARAQFTADRPITFVGATDLQDGSLPASALVWRSSLDGVIGRGPSITATLKPATHVITLTGTNKAGLSGTASTTVTVAAVPPVVAASIVP